MNNWKLWAALALATVALNLALLYVGTLIVRAAWGHQ